MMKGELYIRIGVWEHKFYHFTVEEREVQEHITFGTLILWNGQEGILQSRCDGEWHYVDRHSVSPYHVNVMREGMMMAYTTAGDMVKRAESVYGNWEWIRPIG